jgi:hypothetical protein
VEERNKRAKKKQIRRKNEDEDGTSVMKCPSVNTIGGVNILI